MADLLMPLLTPALGAVLVAAGLLVAVPDWRLSLVALLVEYLGAAVLLTQLVLPEVALVKLLVGLLVVTLLAVTGWQAGFGLRAVPADGAVPPARRLGLEVRTGLTFRLLAVLMVGVAAAYIASQAHLALPGLEATPALNTASYVLMGLGLLNLGLTDEPVNVGMGLLTILIGFEMFYAAVEPSLAVAAMLAGVHFAIGLAVSYLALLHHADEQRELES
ncbi:MAG: hypothetical protein IT317_06640 [Anaerolineales bacterium]|nr:hypothetical protein [Anaerolineales bacterium]